MKWFCTPCGEKLERVVLKVCDVEVFLNLNNTVNKLLQLTKMLNNDNADIIKKFENVNSENVRLGNELKSFKQEVAKGLPSAKPKTSGTLVGNPETIKDQGTEFCLIEDGDQKDLYTETANFSGRSIESSNADEKDRGSSLDLEI